MILMDWIAELFGQRRVALSGDELAVWHKCRTPFWAKVSGRNPSGQAWRRTVNGKWEYRQDPETEEQFLDRLF
jgi:hypothetical protein